MYGEPTKVLFSFTLRSVKLATAASDTESFLPMDRAAMDRWLKEVLRASSRLTTMLINYSIEKKQQVSIIRVLNYL